MTETFPVEQPVVTNPTVSVDKVQVAMQTLQTLLAVAAGVSAVVGGQSVPVVGGLQVAQALLPIAQQFVMQIGTQPITMDVSKITTEQVVSALQADIEAGFPVLKFS